MHQDRKGTAAFETTEDQFFIEIKVDNRGRLDDKGYVEDAVGIANKLSFTLNFDQTFLGRTMPEMKNALAEVRQDNGGNSNLQGLQGRVSRTECGASPKWEFDCDRQATQQAYSRVKAGGADTCTCKGCRNFVRARETLYPLNSWNC